LIPGVTELIQQLLAFPGQVYQGIGFPVDNAGAADMELPDSEPCPFTAQPGPGDAVEKTP